MILCPKCSVQVIPGAKYCHSCGDKVVERSKPCPVCTGTNPIASVFCHHCGFHFSGRPTAAYQPRYRLDLAAGDLTEQIKALFFAQLRARVAEEHDLQYYSDFVEPFYTSSFRSIYEIRSEQIAKDLRTHFRRFGQEGLPEIDLKLEASFEGLMDYFIIQFCPDLHGFSLPASILKHEQSEPGKTSLTNLVFDYLDLEREPQEVYTNFLTMPSDYLANACQRFLFANRKEKVLFILDLSVKGNCKEGIAMTDQAIYWKMPFQRARKVEYTALQHFRKEQDWVLINDYFFAANPGFNLKLFKLLKKLKGWKEPVLVV